MLCFEHCDTICVWHCINIASLLNLLLQYIYFPLEVFYFRVDFSKCFIACITCTFCCVFIHDHVTAFFVLLTHIFCLHLQVNILYFFPLFVTNAFAYFLFNMLFPIFVQDKETLSIWYLWLGYSLRSSTQLYHQAFIQLSKAECFPH